MEKVIVYFFAIVFGLAIGLAIDFIVAFAVEALWNGVLVNVVSGVKTVSFWQALGLLLLSGFLFRPMNLGGGSESKK